MTRKSTTRSRKNPSRNVPATGLAASLPSAAELRRIADRILKLSEADETEVWIDAVADATTRFANNSIHQNMAEQSLAISLRTVFDGRTARATTNKGDEESLRRVVAASSEMARQQPKNADLLPDSRNNTGSARQSRPARARARDQAQSNRGRDLLHGIVRIGSCQLEGLVRCASPDASGVFHHRDGQRFIRLGKSQFAGRARHQSR
ncbi:MAG: hypothetical protein HY046_13605 [Acidobacteria bacterium]|nr:hypothetical protein [Acidobacteriota bacterium]